MTTHAAFRRRRLLIGLGAVIAVVAIVRLMLPHWLTDTLNRRMAAMGDYRGQVADVDLSLYRGAYRIHGMRIEKRSGEVPEPLLAVPQLDLSIRWRELFAGALVGEAVFHSPRVNFVDGRSASEDQAGRGVDWRARLEELFPARLDRVVIHDGTVAFLNPFTTPAVELHALDVEAVASNLTNVRDADGRRVADVEAQARILDDAPLELSARFDPFGRFEDFSLDLRVQQVSLPRLNDLTRAYAGLDLSRGSGDLVLELDAADGRLSGYAKPLLNDLEILDWEQDVERDRDNPLRLLWEGLGEALSELFSNQPKDRFATRIPIEGRIDEPDTGALDAVIGILRNAFVRAYEAHFEGGDGSSD